MAVDLRKDSPHPNATELSYPPNPDSRGMARKSWQGQSYSFGKHNTPESWVLFGEWRRHLIETSETLKTAEVRERLVNSKVIVDDPAPVQMTPRSLWPTVAICAAVTILLCSITGTAVRMMSTPPTSVADEEFASLTDEEKNIIRGQRRLTARRANLGSGPDQADRGDRIAAKLAAIRSSEYGKDANHPPGNGS